MYSHTGQKPVGTKLSLKQNSLEFDQYQDTEARQARHQNQFGNGTLSRSRSANQRKVSGESGFGVLFLSLKVVIVINPLSTERCLCQTIPMVVSSLFVFDREKSIALATMTTSETSKYAALRNVRITVGTVREYEKFNEASGEFEIDNDTQPEVTVTLTELPDWDKEDEWQNLVWTFYQFGSAIADVL
jgi:hypothetical protein